MGSRALWKGALRVGDLVCPVSLVTAVSTSERIAFHTVNRATGHRLNRQFVDAETGDVVGRDEQAKGYDTGEGETIVLEEAEIAAAVPESDKILAAQHFVPCASMDDLYLDKPYYLLPSDKAATATFSAIRDALAAGKVAALAQTVLFRRVRTVLIRADESGMIATLLSFDYQLRQPSDAFGHMAPIKIEPEMLKLAEHIIKTKMGAFDPKTFDDRYENAVAEMVKAKLSGKPLKLPKPAPQSGNVVSLMDALRESAKGSDSTKPKAKSAAKRAPSGAKSKAAKPAIKKAS